MLWTNRSQPLLGPWPAGSWVINRGHKGSPPPPAASLIFSWWTLHACVVLIYVKQKSKEFQEALVIGHWSGPFTVYLCLVLEQQGPHSLPDTSSGPGDGSSRRQLPA